VIENGSSDGTQELLRGRELDGEIVWNSRNAGFAGSNNQGAAIARGRVLLFLNADAELLQPETIAMLATALDDPAVGIAGPMLLNPDGSLQPTCSAHPSLLRAAVLGLGIHRFLPARALRRVAPEFWSPDHDIDTGWLNFAALAIRADLFRELGGCWAMEYGEDEDLAFRAQRRGYRVRYVSAARVMHVGNFSFGQQRSDIERAVRVARAELTFLRTHYTRPRATAIRAIVGAGYAARALVLGWLGRPARASVYRSMARTYATFRAPAVRYGAGPDQPGL
ncbi:MAG: glycosyltransferase, partial [Actinobacteria bacterium]|nr:glycosyltransferase [Actinomycetota bacterium]